MGFTAGYKVNEGTNYEFTVSNETISEVVQDTGISESDIGQYCYSALFDSRVAKIVATQHHTSFEPDWESIVASNYYTYFPATSPLTSAIPTFNKDLLNSTDAVYQRNFLMWSGTIYPNTPDEKTGEFLVMDIKDIKKWYLDFSNAGFSNTPVSVTSDVNDQVPLPVGYTWPGYTGNAYKYVSNTNVHATMNTLETTENIDKNLYVINVLNFNDELAVGELNPSTHGQSDIGMEDIKYAGMRDEWLNRYGGYLNPASPQKSYQGVTGDWGAVGDYRETANYPGAPRGDLVNVSFESWAELSNDEMLYQLTGNWGQQNANCAMQGTQLSITKNLNIFLKWMSWCGLLFKFDGVTYKPIIENGVIIGYSSDMFVPSEFDTMTNVTGNNISPTPPSPTPGPYDDDPWHGVSFSGVGVGGAGAFATCYYMTSTELANLRTWMSGTGVPEGFDPMAQIIGLSQVPVALSGNAPETVKFINSSAVYDPGITSRVVDSGVNTQQAMGTPIKYSLGSVTISRRMQERGEPYLDYDCQVELYLPLVGVFSLDTQAVMGRTIEAEAILDPVSGTLAAYAWVSKDGQKLPIAYGSTSVGVDLPITAQQYSVAKGALKQANAQLGTALLSSALTMIASASASGKASQSGGRSGSSSSGIQQANNNSFSQAAGIAASQTMVSQTGNVFGSFMDWGRTVRQLSYGNNTAISGSFGGSAAQWSYPFQAYVKIIRPRFEKPDNYAHTQGVPCVQAKKIKNCTGFIQCIGVDVKNIAGATDLERQAIQAALSNGIYAGGGQ